LTGFFSQDAVVGVRGKQGVDDDVFAGLIDFGDKVFGHFL